jgi:putative drug exporter of the RND superfamily
VQRAERAAQHGQTVGESLGAVLGLGVQQASSQSEEDADRRGGESTGGEAVGRHAGVRADSLSDRRFDVVEAFAFKSAQVGVARQRSAPQAPEVVLGGEVLALGLQPALEPVDRGAGSAAKLGVQPVERLVQSTEDDVLLGGEPGVDGSWRDVGALGDLRDRRTVEATFEDQLDGGARDRAPRALVVAFSPSDGWLGHARSLRQNVLTHANLHSDANLRYSARMAIHLQRLGRLSFRHRRVVLTAWIAILVMLGGAAVAANGSFVSNFSIPGTESQKAIDLLQQRLPGASAGGASGRVAFAAAAGKQLTPQQKRAISGTLARIADTPAVASVSNPFATGAISADKRVTYAQITFRKVAGDLSGADLDAVSHAERAAREAGVQVFLAGDAAPTNRNGGIPPEVIGLAVALVVLLVTFRSMAAAGMPLLTAGIGLGVGITSITLLSALTELSSVVTTLAAMLGLAVGIDYALFIISRHRAQAQAGMELEDSVAHAVGTAGSAVVFAGATVVIALVALAVTGVPFLTAMGYTAAFTVAIAVLIAITLVPALLGFAGARASKGKRFAVSADQPRTRTLGGRWIAFVVRHRVPAIALTVLATAALAVPLLHLRLGLPDDSSAAPGTQQRQAYDILSKSFGPGFNGPLTVVADIPKGSDADKVAATIHTRLSALRDVAAVAPAQFSPDRTLAIVSLIPSSGPSTTATEDLVRAVRAQEGAVHADTGAQLAVTGPTAVGIDVASRMGSALVPYLLVVVGLAFLLLMIAFRSVLVPLTAVAGFLLSIGAALGAMVGVFQEGFAASLFGVETAPIVSLLPILMIGILFGLAMDYQVFLVSHMHEAHAQGHDAQDAVRHGFTQSARVVTAAALIMASVFAGFILPDDAIVKSIGFALTVGILIDAFLIRMTLIPALMSLLGARAWWLPRWLERVIPNVDIEGAGLERRHPARPRLTPEPETARVG